MTGRLTTTRRNDARRLLLGGALVVCGPVVLGAQTSTLAPAQRFVVTDTSVREGSFHAVALGRDRIVSTYPRAAREVRFRFSINGLENEFPGGTEHTIYLRPRGGTLVTRVYRFADETEPPPPVPNDSTSSEEGTARVTFRVDLRDVKRTLASGGTYAPPLGAAVKQIEHVYVLGDPAPLSWDYAALKPGSEAELTDADGDGVYEGTVAIATQYTRPQATDGSGGGEWRLKADVSAYPHLVSKQRIQDAIYDLSLEELTERLRPDGALSAGAKWEGVWTRDVSLSAILSLALIAPDATRKSLMAKVDSSGRIIQDTGTGGSWPASSDRMVWALAAWELYAATGDRDWLRTAYDVTRRSAEADLHAVRDPATGLFRGESSFEDWREQSYPRWMQPADIYQSENVGTNAVHYAAYRTLANMARSLGEPGAARWDSVAAGIQRGMTERLWLADRGWFAQYRYGRVSMATSPRADGLGEALASIYGSATLAQRRALMANAPVTAYGTPSFWPFIAGERFYHNATVWPFVTAYWTWAAAEGGNTEAVRRGLDDATRTAALFLTNKENTVAATGHYEGTALNSDGQLWSVAGTLAGTYRLLFGMRLDPDRLRLTPMVPPSYAGDRTLTGFRYRGATLSLTVHGFGDGVRSVTMDGRPLARAEVPASTTGAHAVVVTMNGRWPKTAVHEVPARFAPATPRATLAAGRLTWSAVPGAVRYVVYRNGRAASRVTATSAPAAARDGLDEYQVLAVDAAGSESFLSEPVRVLPGDAEVVAKPEGARLETQYAGFTGAGYARLERERNTTVTARVTASRDGVYAIDARYANGNGPVNTEDKNAVRTLLVDGDTAGVLVMPQRGVQRWTEWGWSNALRARLTAGAHVLTITYTALDANMNGRENTALLDEVRVTRLSGEAAGGAPSPARTVGAAGYDSSRDLGPLFRDVQLARVFPDSKTFVDATPKDVPAAIAARYAAERTAPGFSLGAFVARWFTAPAAAGAGVRSDTAQSVEAHVRALWPALTRAADVASARSSLVPLPHPYVVPGGRFREVYYWDSYFTMLGLVRDGRTDLAKSILDNFAYLVRTVGHVPNGNRTYYLSRSQPPYLAAMVGLYARAADTARALVYLPALEAEHAFWMDGAERVGAGEAYRRVARLPSGALLNRYWDDRTDPRPESWREDDALGQSSGSDAERQVLYRNIRASAESGWDFSSRWMRDPKDLRSLETTELVPVDLNAILFDAERTIAALLRARGRAGDAASAARYEAAAVARRDALVAAAWDSSGTWFDDVRWRTGERVAGRPTLAAASVLYFGLAKPDQGRGVAARLDRDFLKPGGFVTSAVASGQQWDAPNGWPPLQWLAIEGARRYGRADLADAASARWMALVRRTYRTTGRMLEKYDVVDTTRASGGGEYPTQDGFGWTNGVAAALSGVGPGRRR